jgi:hypothetical protein
MATINVDEIKSPQAKILIKKAQKSLNLSQKSGPTLSLWTKNSACFRLNFKPGPILSQAKLP